MQARVLHPYVETLPQFRVTYGCVHPAVYCVITVMERDSGWARPLQEGRLIDQSVHEGLKEKRHLHKFQWPHG